MTNQEAAKLLAKMHLHSMKMGERLTRKRGLKGSEKAMWLSDLKQERLALAIAYKALTGLDLTKEG
jgi:hypothetical protein